MLVIGLDKQHRINTRHSNDANAKDIQNISFLVMYSHCVICDKRMDWSQDVPLMPLCDKCYKLSNGEIETRLRQKGLIK
jgi:hypothetical protein